MFDLYVIRLQAYFDHNYIKKGVTCCFSAGTGAAERSKAGAGPAEPAGGVQERHLSAAGSEAATADRGRREVDSETQSIL